MRTYQQRLLEAQRRSMQAQVGSLQRRLRRFHRQHGACRRQNTIKEELLGLFGVLVERGADVRHPDQLYHKYVRAQDADWSTYRDVMGSTATLLASAARRSQHNNDGNPQQTTTCTAIGSDDNHAALIDDDVDGHGQRNAAVAEGTA
eukprot:m.488645 g.488645  ORF g.488645 m.488645 type:complete len:147 (+) comp25973_c0_seq1:290-730(+)